MSLQRVCDRCGKAVTVQDGGEMPHGWGRMTLTRAPVSPYEGRDMHLCTGCRAHVYNETRRLPEEARRG